MISSETLSKIKSFAYNNSEKDDIHGFEHVERVLKTSLEIGAVLGANLLVIKIAALFHDLGRNLRKEEITKNHSEISAEIAKDFIITNKIKISNEDLENVIHCIKSHSFSNNIKHKTLEAKILFDADKLDALGAIGLYRTIGFTIKNRGGIEQVIKHLEYKILKLKDLVYLDYSKQIAEKRHKLVLNFYNQINEEK